jgi:hypothetical protein
MTSIPSYFLQTAMRRSLLGSHANDPVVPDRAQGAAAPRPAAEDADAPLRIGRFDDGLAARPDARSRRRVGTFADGLARTRRLAPAPALDPRAPAPVEAGAEQRRAA